MKVGLCTAKQSTFHFNIAIAELTAMKRNRPVPDAMLVLWNNGACGRVACRPENISACGGNPHPDCRDNATVVSRQRDGAVVLVQHRII
jgi:hypothetical protein